MVPPLLWFCLPQGFFLPKSWHALSLRGNAGDQAQGLLCFLLSRACSLQGPCSVPWYNAMFSTGKVVPRRGCLRQRLDSVQGIKWLFIQRPSEDTPWPAQEPGRGPTQDGHKMDDPSQVFPLFSFRSIAILGVNCPITASAYAVASSQMAFFPSPLFTLLGLKLQGCPWFSGCKRTALSNKTVTRALDKVRSYTQRQYRT